MALEPITRQEKIIAGQDLTPITRMEKFLKQYGGGSGGSGGGSSSDAVLYTAQTLTDAQKKQARANIDAASDFVINGEMVSGETVTLDKTFAQIKEALSAGKRPTVRIVARGKPLYFYYSDALLSTPGSEYIVFIGAIDTYSVIKLVAYADSPTYVFTAQLVELVGNTLPQQTMLADPTENMQIATKKYVDDKECILKSTTPGSTKKFKMTVDDSGNISATEVT